jgi:hypothetical protein
MELTKSANLFAFDMPAFAEAAMRWQAKVEIT